MSQTDPTNDPRLSRYARQIRFGGIGTGGQQRLMDSRALICGCGALGSVIANTLARAGVGSLRIIDRDFLEISNLQRQVLFDEQDVAQGLPKVIAAANKLRAINSTIEIESIVADVNYRNLPEFCRGVDVLLDGTDNFETRFLLNDAALKYSIPFIYGGCLGSEGQSMTVLPGETPCLQCLIPESPPPGTTPTCDSAGILSTIINVIASIQSTEALKILSGNRDAVQRGLLLFDVWENRYRQLQISGLSQTENCPACHQRIYSWLDGSHGIQPAVLCGRNAVQLVAPENVAINLDMLEQKLTGLGRISRNPFLLRFAVEPYQLTIFKDGRTIVSGTDDVLTAKSVFARYIGN